MTELVRLENVSKTFPGVKALDDVSLTICSGEILALVGENGAGKSTLMKILSGAYPSGSFTGQIRIDGTPLQFRSPIEAENAGIAIIHQELSSFLHLTVAENIFAGHWQTRFGLIDWPKLQSEAQKWLDAVGSDIDASTIMGTLSVGSQQMVEIAKALARNSRVLILDEPTSALTPREVENLFKLLRDLKSKGKGLVYISHKMEEIYELADRITVLRDGQTVQTANATELSEDKLITHMVGRSLSNLFPQSPPRVFGETQLSVSNYSGIHQSGKKVFGPLNFSVKKGEILGFSGLLGAGRSEMLQSLFGDAKILTTGRVELLGRHYSDATPRKSLKEHLAFVGEDRKRDSIFPFRSLEENVSIARLASGSLFSWLNSGQEYLGAVKSLKQLNTKATGPEMLIQQLSGGNQQKVILGRTLQTDPAIILLDEPTRGVDVGAKYEIYEILFALAQQGKTLLVASSDLPELMALSDRIVVLSQGHQMGSLERSDFSQTAIMKLAVSTPEFSESES